MKVRIAKVLAPKASWKEEIRLVKMKPARSSFLKRAVKIASKLGR